MKILLLPKNSHQKTVLDILNRSKNNQLYVTKIENGRVEFIRSAIVEIPPSPPKKVRIPKPKKPKKVKRKDMVIDYMDDVRVFPPRQTSRRNRRGSSKEEFSSFNTSALIGFPETDICNGLNLLLAAYISMDYNCIDDVSRTTEFPEIVQTESYAEKVFSMFFSEIGDIDLEVFKQLDFIQAARMGR